MLNEYKANLQNNPDLKTNILAVYSSVSKEYPLPYVTTIEYFPENKLQAQNASNYWLILRLKKWQNI